MPDLSPFLAALPVFLLCLLAQRGGRGGGIPGRVVGVARVGLGLGKIILLAVPLERVTVGAMTALPEAQSATVAWMSLFAFSFQLYLVLSGVADVVVGGCQILKREAIEVFGAPFRAGGFIDFWSAWNLPLAKALGFRGTVLSVGLLVSVVAIWRGVSLGTLAWLTLHLVLLGFERWRGKGLFAPLPLPIRAALTVSVVLISNVLLFMMPLQEGLNQVQRLFVSSSATAYSVLLDARLSTPLPLTCLWVSALCCVALPPASWVLAQPWRIWRGLGIVTGVVAMAIIPRFGAISPDRSGWAAVRHAVQWPLTLWMREGNDDIFVGHDGWLYPQRELDFLTLKSADADGAGAILGLAAELSATKTPLLVVAVPEKAALYPEYILPAEYAAPVLPRRYLPAVERLRAAGVSVLDPSDVLWRAQKKFPLYFRKDSAWTPEALKEVALSTAKLVRTSWPGVAVDETPLINANIHDLEIQGNLARMLDPWAPESLGEKETAQIVSLTGLQHSENSPVLVLGGELIQAFEIESAGFVTQLAALLGRSLATGPAVTDPQEQSRLRVRQLAVGKRLVIVVVKAGDL